ncbi:MULTISPECIES: hypothetical protein [Corallococcus]|uniref:Uncharacterized protein n=2 Tax=Corallococcus TaxID=83461 RepID=A0A7Y4JQC2_9BACT|nr:hypothetical protein [Corallococcus exercitus]NOK08312.1 hypothetical protein [Corallococcus exercitus]GMU06977.1 hypothetical protein ASNO1_32300 [Corallococcus sp. NO1]
MHSKRLHHWTLVAVCAATAALVGPGCNRDEPLMPRAGSRYQGVANTQQPAPPGTGGAGASTPTDAKGSPLKPQPAGAQGLQNQIGAPGFTTLQEPVPGDRGGADRFEGPMGQGSELGSRHAPD